MRQAQQQSGPVLPSNPSGLGSGWQDVTPIPGGKVNPKIPKRFRGPKGTEVEFDPGVAGKPGWGGKDHWHEFGPDGKAETDIDHGHDHGAGDPHAHDWDWGKKPPRQPGRPAGGPELLPSD